ncbi:MAG: DNA-3-methyladenine glycosylase 2 family protein [Pseudomonadota bacterium]
MSHSIPTRLIETDDDIREGCAALAVLEPRFATALEVVGDVPLRRRPAGFDALLKAICSQQLSVASANAVWAKLEAAGATAPDPIRSLGTEGLKACGLSRQKAAYALALAEAELDLEALRHLPEEEAVAMLTAVKGIGPWTAEIYLMFALGRADVFAPGDLALQEAARMLFDLDERPREKPFRAMAAAWSPWRAVAARVLWAYYAAEKRREGIGADA